VPVAEERRLVACAHFSGIKRAACWPSGVVELVLAVQIAARSRHGTLTGPAGAARYRRATPAWTDAFFLGSAMRSTGARPGPRR
jgi:hypothetical protein